MSFIVVYYMLETAEVYGWLCSAGSSVVAEKKFWEQVGSHKAHKVKDIISVGMLFEMVRSYPRMTQRLDVHGVADKRPPLLVDLTGAFTHIYIVLGLARDLLTEEQQERFDAEVRPAIHPDTRQSTKEILAIVAKYVHLQDPSGSNPDYPLAKEEGGE